MERVIFYHAGCNVCKTAEENVLKLLDKNMYKVEIVHLGEDKSRLDEAESWGVKSVPALVYNGQVFHINYGASLQELKS